MDHATSLDSVAHVVQVALTPVFLLSGVAALLNVFATRLARVADRVDRLAMSETSGQAEPDQDAQLRLLRFRSATLDWAVVLAALAGVMTCGAAVVLFVGALRDAAAAGLLFILFGGGLIATMGALAAFALEIVTAGRGVRYVAKSASRSGL